MSAPFNLLTKLNSPDADTDKCSITISWSAPNNFPNIVSYVIQAYIGGVAQTGKFYTNSNKTITTVYYLFYGLSYSFTVAALNNQGQLSAASKQSTAVVIKPSKPSAPNQITPSSIAGQSRATLSWTDNVLNGGTATSHTIQINNQTTGKSTLVKFSYTAPPPPTPAPLVTTPPVPAPSPSPSPGILPSPGIR